jgi:hypothetical protein
MLFFRSEEHVERWCSSWRLERGATLSPLQAWRLAFAWYSRDRRDPAWTRPTLEETEALFASLGLTDSYWSLR